MISNLAHLTNIPKKTLTGGVLVPLDLFHRRLNPLRPTIANARFWESCDFGCLECLIHFQRQWDGGRRHADCGSSRPIAAVRLGNVYQLAVIAAGV